MRLSISGLMPISGRHADRTAGNGAGSASKRHLPEGQIETGSQRRHLFLLSLLHLGIKDIRLGPSLPAFVTPNVLNVLVENFEIKPISTPDEDLRATLAA